MMFDIPQWQKPPKREELFDGDEFLVALRVKNRKTGRIAWEFDKVQIRCDGDDEGGFFELHYAEGEGESYDAWTWEDFELCIRTSNFPKDVQTLSGIDK